jgi:hypothetical protein
MADDGRKDFLKRLFGRRPPARPQAEPEWLRMARELKQRWHPQVNFAGTRTIEEMDEAILRHQRRLPDGPTDDELIGWLRLAGADDWHRSALTWNWDNDFGPIAWIIAQPECDAGTAISLFALGEPGYYTQFDSMAAIEAGAPYMMETVRFLMDICERWAAGQYRSYRFRPERVPDIHPGSMPWAVPESLARAPMRGEALDTDNWVEGYPLKLLRH